MKRDIFESALQFSPTINDDTPLVCFVHVPKAAGTSVNQHLRRWSWRGLEHVERFFQSKRDARSRIGRSRWISGHLSLEKMLELLSSTGVQHRNKEREIRLFGAIRNPAEQIAAHVNWQIEIFRRGRRFFQAHPPAIQDVSNRIRSADLSNPKEVTKILANSPALFANLQSRFLLGNESNLTKETAEERFQSYEAIRPTANLAALLRDITGQTPRRVQRANASKWHFDRSVFDTPEVQSFLRKFNARDQALYERVSKQT